MEHFPIYTIGLKKIPNKIKLPFKIIETDRGGDITFHGLGQIIFYTLINLKEEDFLKTYVRLLENVIISVLTISTLMRQESKVNRVYMLMGKNSFYRVKIYKGFLYHGFALTIKLILIIGHINPCGYIT